MNILIRSRRYECTSLPRRNRFLSACRSVVLHNTARQHPLPKTLHAPDYNSTYPKSHNQTLLLGANQSKLLHSPAGSQVQVDEPTFGGRLVHTSPSQQKRPVPCVFGTVPVFNGPLVLVWLGACSVGANVD